LLANPEDIPLLQAHLDKIASRIRIHADAAVVTIAFSVGDERAGRERARLGSVLDLLAGPEPPCISKPSSNLPQLPVGWALHSMIEAWLRQDRFDHTQVEPLLWMLRNRSENIWETIDPGIADDLKAAFSQVLAGKFTGFRGSAGHGRANPAYAQWMLRRRQLADELAWLVNGK
jgi:hypothetical protein